jgi:hypothetical protein
MSKKQHNVNVETIQEMPLTHWIFFDPDLDTNDSDDTGRVYGPDAQNSPSDISPSSPPFSIRQLMNIFHHFQLALPTSN